MFSECWIQIYSGHILKFSKQGYSRGRISEKGIAITQNIQEHKGLYPLGYNLTPSLGFGSFCATDLNISNTCPIVLWWGNVIEKETSWIVGILYYQEGLVPRILIHLMRIGLYKRQKMMDMMMSLTPAQIVGVV